MLQRSGFSLVELSIVLVILGLLTGGILSGQALIRAAELRSVSADTQRYTTAIHSFRDKYFALPGDMPNAVQFWGAADGSTGMTVTCKTTSSSTPATCNGSGNGIIDTLPTYSNEVFRFWQHLANAVLIEGTYTGIAGTGNYNHHIATENAPGLRINNGGIGIYYRGSIGVNVQWWPGSYGHVFFLGGQRVGNPHAPIFATEEAWNIDTKLDDGRPGHGRVVSFKSSFVDIPGCTTTDDKTTSEYALASSGPLCAIAVLTGY